MSTVRAKCPNCWETDECEIVETKNWYGKDSDKGGAAQQPAPGSGYNLKCPTCQGMFWHEIRPGSKSM